MQQVWAVRRGAAFPDLRYSISYSLPRPYRYGQLHPSLHLPVSHSDGRETPRGASVQGLLTYPNVPKVPKVAHHAVLHDDGERRARNPQLQPSISNLSQTLLHSKCCL
jgi:hypothetical protein